MLITDKAVNKMIFRKEKTSVCACGREHGLTTVLAVVDDGALKNVESYIKEVGLSGVSVAIYDENTYNAEGLIRPRADYEIILPPENLHANEHGVALVKERMPKKCDYLIAVGSGTVHDITRYIAHEIGVPFVSCPTAASVDGFCSSVAAMTWCGFKKTFTAVAPTLVVADTEVISRAPMRLTRAGFGDMIGKYIALTDWRVSHILTGEYLCEEIFNLTKSATLDVMDSAEAIKSGDKSAYGKLIYGLLMSGIAMQMLGNSRCASGAEHHISHLIEMSAEGLGVSSDALHGEKVGVGTLIALGKYHQLIDSGLLLKNDYKPADAEYITSAFGKTLADSIIAENEKDACLGITAKGVEEKYTEIKAIVDELPTSDELLGIYNILGAVTTLSDIGVDEEKTEKILEYSPLVRNRLTLMRLRRATLGD